MKDRILKILRDAEGYISGERISEELNISRAAVWKHIKRLREEGYEIESATNRGYILKSSDILNADEIKRGLCTEVIGRDIVFFEETDSTNNAAKRDSGRADGTLFISEIQNGGKGRLGRAWSSPRGAGIWMSLLLKPDLLPGEVPKITLAAGLAVCRALKGYGAKIKWPNDIVIGGKKLCGILTEMAAEMDSVSYVVCGIGINVNNTEFPADLSDKATSLYIETGDKKNRAEIVRSVLYEFEQLYREFLKNGLKNIKSEYEKYLVNIGVTVRAISKSGELIGAASGITEDGELIIETDGGKVIISSGEVSVRGIYGYV